MSLIRAAEKDIDDLLAFYRHVADNMEAQGIDHWHWGRYPNEEFIREDVARGEMYYMLEGSMIAAAVVITAGQEEEYNSLPWSCGVRPGSFRRLAVHPSMQGAGLGGLVLDDVLQLLRRSGCDCARCDTAEVNRHAIRLYEKLGFRPCGTMYWPDAPGRNVTLDKPLKRETPMWPIRMFPAFRDGALTGTTLRFYPISVSGEAGYNDYSPVFLEGADAERVLKKMEESTGVSPGAFDPAGGAAVSVP